MTGVTTSATSASLVQFPPAPTFYDANKSFATATGAVVHPMPQITARGGSASYPNREQKDAVSPWLEAFVNARKWIEQQK